MLKAKIISSLEKVFFDSSFDSFDQLERISILKNERLSFQLLYTLDEPNDNQREMLGITVDAGALTPFISCRNVINIPVLYPVFEHAVDDNYLKTTPGLYPDLLEPMHYNNTVSVVRNQTHSVWIELDLRNYEADSGIYTVIVALNNAAGAVIECKLELEVINACLPEQQLLLTQWFHCDSLASFYNCQVWSEKHWQVVENFAKTAVNNGINLLLTPVFTPPLDTQLGGERLTTQLVKVKKIKGKYHFDFSLLDRWVEMCDRVGIKYFEISHLFTQWGAGHAPKVMATVDGEYKRIFGWDTDATSEEYVGFLRVFLKRFIAHMKKSGNDTRCLFHISDEPNETQLESYKAAKDSISDLLEGYTVMDALSNYEFFKQGVVKTPIPSNNHISTFIENNTPDLWTYYCCGQSVNVSNRFIAMPSYRNRSIGMQMFKYDIKGFLQWGYNFYNNMSSVNPVNPYTDASGEFWVPAGDCYSVYPSTDGKALESLRIIVFYEAIQDMRAMALCSSLYGKDQTVKAIEDVFGKAVTFDTCAYSSKMILDIREKINRMIADAN